MKVESCSTMQGRALGNLGASCANPVPNLGQIHDSHDRHVILNYYSPKKLVEVSQNHKPRELQYQFEDEFQTLGCDAAM